MSRRNRRLAQTLRGMPLGVRRLLLQALMAPPAERAKLIGQLHERAGTPGLVELLIDLEEDRLLALEIADALKAGLSGRALG